MSAFWIAMAAAGLMPSCAAEADDPARNRTRSPNGEDGAGGASGLGTAEPGGFGTGEPGSLVDLGGSGVRTDDAGTCLDEVTEGEQLPMDMFIVFDISGSMNNGNPSRMNIVRDALVEFLQDPATAGIGTGISYFPQIDPRVPATCSQDADCDIPGVGDFGPCAPLIPFGTCDDPLNILFNPCGCWGADICDADAYSQPAVPITLPPNPAPVVASLHAQNPAGFTPMRPALQGAHNYAAAWAAQHPDRKMVVVLVGDGVPAGCANNTIATSENVVQAALNGPFQIPTFVVGVGDALEDLNRVAAAGGTEQAYLMSDAEAGTRFKEAMDDIRGRAIPCDVLIPRDQDIDPDRVNIDFIPRGGTEPVEVLRTHDGRESSCDPVAGGWFYDDPNDPSQISMCPATCSEMERGGRRLSVKLGCETKVQDIR